MTRGVGTSGLGASVGRGDQARTGPGMTRGVLVGWTRYD